MAKADIVKRKNLLNDIKKYMPFYIMFLPIAILFIVICYIPIAGIALAFTEYTPFRGPDFIGLDNFSTLLGNNRFLASVKNTLVLSLVNQFLGVSLAVILSLLLHELRSRPYKRVVQTLVYMPHFMSWVVVASIFTILLSPQRGAVNSLLEMLGIEPIYFLASKQWWTPIFLFVMRWRETGWMTIIYFAALSGINPEIYEAARIDGASRWRQAVAITVPLLLPTILTVLVLNLAKVLNIFEPVFVMQNDMVLDQAEVIATYVYKVGLRQSDYGYATAVGLFKSLIALALVVLTDKISVKIKGDSLL